MAGGESKSESKSEPVYTAFLDISRYPYTEANRIIFSKSGSGRREDDVARNLWDFENKGIFLPPREKEEIAAEARKRGANIVVQSYNEQYGRPYIFLRLNDKNFLKIIERFATKF